IEELEAERIEELEAYLTATGLKNYKLSQNDVKSLDEFNEIVYSTPPPPKNNNKGSGVIQGRYWRKFQLKDLFEIKNTHNILSTEIVTDSGATPYLCASAANNAVNSYIDYDENFLETGNCIFIGGKTFVVTYQQNNFYSNDSHNLALYLKNAETTELNQLSLVTCIYKNLRHKYTWNNSVSHAKILSDTIFLPVKNNEPDYAFMERFMIAVQKLVIKDIVVWTNKKMEAYKKVVKMR
ncbi:restriction endonuclease subunit S, partial [Treponema putidum]|uniref:restriction endonuclease subunit S n=1 Tax=Treponema putidum TaxID=221027 RepID=UPI003D8E8AE4